MATGNKLYSNITLPAPRQSNFVPASRAYRGFSTVSNDTNTYILYDLNLIKQDIINHFHIRQGERLEQPEFGTIIWDLLFEPLTDQVRSLIINNVETIINFDPRVRSDQIIVTQYETGIQIECTLTYLPYNISEALRFKFDQDNGLIN
jgi:phage baseplate assembly protein W